MFRYIRGDFTDFYKYAYSLTIYFHTIYYLTQVHFNKSMVYCQVDWKSKKYWTSWLSTFVLFVWNYCNVRRISKADREIQNVNYFLDTQQYVEPTFLINQIHWSVQTTAVLTCAILKNLFKYWTWSSTRTFTMFRSSRNSKNFQCAELFCQFSSWEYYCDYRVRLVPA